MTDFEIWAAWRGRAGAFQLAALTQAAMLTGCASAPEAVRIAVPVPCRVAVPQRPHMPTEALAPDVALDDFVAAAAAEIERREGYELQLRAALEACAQAKTFSTAAIPASGVAFSYPQTSKE